MTKVSWGVISTAKIGTEKVIPAMQKGEYPQINAIASNNMERAKSMAKKLGIPRAYGSYDELLKDNNIDAIYIPLPNHLHIEWAIKSLEAGKHVLCEKPIGMDLQDAENLYHAAEKFSKLKVMEAFMYRHHPQIKKAKILIADGAIGEIKHINTIFNYYNVDPNNIRNKADIGGGGLLDIGCYCISISRLLFGGEPKAVCASIDYDPTMKIDRQVAGILQFDKGTSSISCSTQLAFSQGAEIFGTKGKITLGTPFTPSPDTSAKIILQQAENIKEFTFEPCNSYTLQGDSFSKSILDDSPVYIPLSDALANMKVIDKIKESSVKNSWVNL
jgi:predicted dehydrogenase